MRVIFGAQGSILKVFCELDKRLRESGFLKSSAYWISNSHYYLRVKSNLDVLSDPTVKQLHEWEYTSISRQNLSTQRRNILEQRYHSLGLWNAIIADRRLMYGSLSKTRQVYSSHFSNSALCNIVYNTLDAMETLVAELQPDAIITFVPATYGDYLLALVAQVHGIRYLQLRSTKIQNYVTFSDNLGAVSEELRQAYYDNLRCNNSFPFKDEAQRFLDQAANRPIDYEGTISRSNASFLKRGTDCTRSLLAALKNSIFSLAHISRRDNHIPPPLATWWHGSFLQPWYKGAASRVMGQRILKLNQIDKTPFVFYPIHSEPEIALAVYGRDHQNQIETIRRIAQSLPLGWHLVVKEHPRCFGYRTNRWYRKILNIPNVLFASPETRPFQWIKKAKAVVTVSGFVGMEALAVGKPVLVLGEVSFSMLPDTLLRKVSSMSDLGHQLIDLIANFSMDSNALNAYVAACMSQGVRVNLYNDLLSKPGRNKGSELNVQNQYSELSKLLVDKLNSQV